MNTILSSRRARPQRAASWRLNRIQREDAACADCYEARIDAHVEIVTSMEAAVRSIGRHIPDVVLTSTFLSPSDETR